MRWFRKIDGGWAAIGLLAVVSVLLLFSIIGGGQNAFREWVSALSGWAAAFAGLITIAAILRGQKIDVRWRKEAVTIEHLKVRARFEEGQRIARNMRGYSEAISNNLTLYEGTGDTNSRNNVIREIRNVKALITEAGLEELGQLDDRVKYLTIETSERIRQFQTVADRFRGPNPNARLGSSPDPDSENEIRTFRDPVLEVRLFLVQLQERLVLIAKHANRFELHKLYGNG